MRAPMVVLPCPLILPGQDPAAEPLTASHARHERLFQQLNSIVRVRDQPARCLP